MNQINNKVKTGFFSTDRKIRIFDSEGSPFYFIDCFNENIKFNLPKGKYFSNNNLKNIDPVVFKKINLPKKEKNKKIPDSVNILVGKNQNKASIFVDLNGIILDKAESKKPKVLVNFILAHELGHYFYYQEKLADQFAYNLLLDYGMNPSQILTANFLTLSNKTESLIRKRQLSLEIQKTI